MSDEEIEILKIVLQLLFIPLCVWIWMAEKRILKLESTIIKLSDLEIIYNKLDELKNDIHSLDDKYISQKSCDYRHRNL